MTGNRKAAGLVVMAMTLISCNDAIIKTVSESLGIGQILFVRGCAACLIFGIAIKASGRPLFPRAALAPANLTRASLEMSATLCFVTGLSLLPIAIAATLVWSSPLLLTLFAGVLLRETVTPARWMAVMVGFMGVLFVTQPFGAGFSAAMLLPLCAAFLVACRDIATRRINPGLHSLHITLATLVLVTVAGGILCILDWRPLELSHLVKLAASAALLSIGFFTQITAVRMGELSFIAPFSFTGIITALVLGYAVWGDVPTPLMICGITLIAAACIYIVRSGARPAARSATLAPRST